MYHVNEIEDELLGKGFTFVLAPGRDPLLAEMFLETEEKVAELSEMYRACFNAEVTPALHALKRMDQLPLHIRQLHPRHKDDLPVQVQPRGSIPEIDHSRLRPLLWVCP
ncbi:hypothetical protein ACWDYJ_19410 [Streptomyces sp. NPDC003042]